MNRYMCMCMYICCIYVVYMYTCYIRINQQTIAYFDSKGNLYTYIFR